MPTHYATEPERLPDGTWRALVCEVGTHRVVMEIVRDTAAYARLDAAAAAGSDSGRLPPLMGLGGLSWPAARRQQEQG